MKNEKYFTVRIADSVQGYVVEVNKYDDIGILQTKYTDDEDFYGENGTYNSLEEAEQEVENQRHLLTQTGLIEGEPSQEA